MTNEVRTLSDNEGKALAEAYSEYKAAEAKFKLLKDTLTKELTEGKHITKYCIIDKTTYTKKSVDYKKACIANEVDVSEYTTENKVTTVSVQPLIVKKSLLNL